MSVNTTVNDKKNDNDNDNDNDNKNDTVNEDVFLTNGYQELNGDRYELMIKYELIIKNLKEDYKKDIEFLQKYYLDNKTKILNEKTTETANLTNQLNQVNGELNHYVRECKLHIVTIAKLKQSDLYNDYTIEPIRKELRIVLEKAKDSWILFRKYSPEGYKTYLIETYGHKSISVELLTELDHEIAYKYDTPTYDTPTYDTPTYDTPTYDTTTYDTTTYDTPTYDSTTYDDIWDNGKTYQIESSKQLSFGQF